MANRQHIKYNDRIRIEVLYNTEKRSATYIAKSLGFGRSTVYNELARGFYERLDGRTWITYKAYSADIAQQDYDRKGTHKGSELKIGKDHALATYIEDKIINEKYSPEAVLLEIKELNLPFSVTISKTTLYRYIDEGLFLRVTNKHLPYGKRPKKAESKTPPRISYRNPLKESIESRPSHVDDREEFGHWEMDTVYSKKGDGSACLLVLTGRKTRYEIGIKLKSRTSEEVIKALDKIERKFERRFKRAFATIFKTITCDNGSEFLDTKGIERSIYKRNKDPRTKLYYCHPFSSYERGSNENQNKMIRRFVPKGTPITNYSMEEIKSIFSWLNHYPRRIFDGKSSHKLFISELAQITT